MCRNRWCAFEETENDAIKARNKNDTTTAQNDATAA